MNIAWTNIAAAAFMNGPKMYIPFFLGQSPLLIAAAPLLGLALGFLDVRLSGLVLSRIDPARLELDAPSIEGAQSPYLGSGWRGIAANGLCVLGEESIRGIFLVLLKENFRWPIYALIAAGTFMFFLSRRIPVYLQAVKLIDDFALTLLFLWGGVISAWLAHLALNVYILWPLLKHE